MSALAEKFKQKYFGKEEHPYRTFEREFEQHLGPERTLLDEIEFGQGLRVAAQRGAAARQHSPGLKDSRIAIEFGLEERTRARGVEFEQKACPALRAAPGKPFERAFGDISMREAVRPYGEQAVREGPAPLVPSREGKVGVALAEPALPAPRRDPGDHAIIVFRLQLNDPIRAVGEDGLRAAS